MDRIFSIQAITLYAVGEAFLAGRLLPDYRPVHSGFFPTTCLTFLFNLLIYAAYWGMIYPFYFSPLRGFPSPKGNPFSRTYKRVFTKEPLGQQFLEWITDTPNDGILVIRSFFHPNRLLLTHPRALADVLVNHSYDFEKTQHVRTFLRQPLGDGLIIVEGDVHKFQRKHVMPAFAFRHIKDLYPMMWRKALGLVDGLVSELERQSTPQNQARATVSGTTEIHSWASKITLDIIGIAGLGREFNCLKNSDDELVKNYEELLQPNPRKLALFLLSGFLSPEIGKAIMRKESKVLERISSSLRSICRQLVADKREAMKSGSDGHFDILSLLINSNDFSDDELISQLLTFLAAGHETTSSAFTWLTYLLALHPEAQSRLRSEIKEAFPVNPLLDPSIDISGILEKLPYLNAVCNESLRLYPNVPNTIRVATCDTTVMGCQIKKGTDILISMWAINRSKALWGTDAESFIPERWITNGKPNNHGGAYSNYSLLTFLHGPRSCIGQNFAKAELRCLAAAFLAVFEWQLDMRAEDVIPAGVITIKPKDGLSLKLNTIGKW